MPTQPSVTGAVAPYFKPGASITFTVKAGQSIIGGRLVEISAGREVQHAAAGSKKVAGVAPYDAAAGNKIAVHRVGVWPLRAGGAITAGDLVVAAANGTVVTYVAETTGTVNEANVETALNLLAGVVGIALEDIANGADGPVELRLG